MLHIELDDHDGHIICRPIGDVDASSVSLFRQVLAEVAVGTRLVIDVSKVYFLDSAGLAALIGGIRRARERGGDVAIACERPRLSRLLRLVGLDRIVTVADDVATAVAALKVSTVSAS
jgi:anti-sigma B factor antagonist